MFSILVHLFELFFDSDKTDRDILGADSDYLAYLFIAEVFQPQQDYCPVERSELGDSVFQEIGLDGGRVAVFKEVYLH